MSGTMEKSLLALLGAGATLALIDLTVLALVHGQQFLNDRPRPVVVNFNCIADNTGVDCVFTNSTEVPALPICITGSLARKDAKGAQVKSIPVCSGALRANESRNIRGYWDGAMANDLCSTEQEVLGKTYKQLDWDKCSFDTNRLI